MVLPIVAYGHPNLHKISQPIAADYPDLAELIENMWETLYQSRGVGLAAPQVNKQIRLFLIDTQQLVADEDEEENLEKIKTAFINAKILETRGNLCSMEEGCLSIPKIQEEVLRPKEVRLSYVDENFVAHDRWFTGYLARVIQHEYDHLEGILFVDKVHSLRKIMLKRKLEDIAKGQIELPYRMIFQPTKR